MAWTSIPVSNTQKLLYMNFKCLQLKFTRTTIVPIIQEQLLDYSPLKVL